GIVSLMVLAPRAVGGPEESIFYPMVGLALLVLSVSVMAYLFFYRPVTMLLDGEREKAVTLFLQTVGIFAVATAAVFLVSLIVHPA
ncbi:hypothetical protein K8R03_04730, partial [Candidatus Kaiserbacteria bacterium]|nr:hypothetical protein [Candidatus Kaiserbacteria bacterium]